jgi:2-methylcitrate dehydratase PrpD
MGFSRTLAVWSSDLSFDDLPEAVVPWVKAAVLDFLAVSAAGSQADGVEILNTYVQGQYAKGSATVIGRSNRMSAEAAALLNGTISHWEEYDDATFGMWGHPSVALMPALFAVAETEGGSGKDFIVSYVAGFEACAKVGRLITPQQVKLGWHPTATVGTIGAATAVGRLLGLDPVQIENAIGMAGSHSSGLRIQFGTMVKPLHAGLASRGGLASAMLSRAGFVGMPGVIEHPHGFAHALSGGAPADIEAFERRLGDPLEIVDPGLAFKRFPSNFQTQSAATGALSLRHKHGIQPEQIEEIVVLANHLMKLSLIHPEPKTGLEAKLSLNYAIAAALVDGQLEVEQYRLDRVQDPQIRAMLKKIRLEPHPEMAGVDFTQGAHFLFVELIAKLTDGREVRERVSEGFSVPGVEGSAPHPQLLDKFRRNARRILSNERVETIINIVNDLENLKNVGEVISMVSKQSEYAS